MLAQRSATFEAIGTVWNVDIYDGFDGEDYDLLMAAIRDRIELFDRTYSRFRSDSLISKMTRKAGSYEMPLDFPELWEQYTRLYELTAGEVTPLIGGILAAAGYDANYSLLPGTLRRPAPLEEILSFKDGRLTLTQPSLLDFGAAGKGYLVDIIGGLLEARGIRRYCVDASGDLRYRGEEPLHVGLEHPGDSTLAIGVAELGDVSLCGSAGNRRAWNGFSHIISPSTLASPVHLQAVWVVAATTLLADALTTALYFKPPLQLAAAYDFEYAYVSSDNMVERSAGFPGTIFTE